MNMDIISEIYQAITYLLFLFLVLIPPVWSIHYIFRIKNKKNISFFNFYLINLFFSLIFLLLYSTYEFLGNMSAFLEYGISLNEIFSLASKFIIPLILLFMINYKIKVYYVLKEKPLLKTIIFTLLISFILLVILIVFMLLMFVSAF